MKKPKKLKTSAKPNPRSSKWEFFDDCGICQAMKMTDKSGRSLSLEELKDIFEKENNKNLVLKELIRKAPE